MALTSEGKMVGSDDTTEATSHPSQDAGADHLHRNDGHDDDQLEIAFSLMRQSSIYSLTLDEIQNTVCEPGKTFGSMNMDEFLTNIWSVEELAAAADSSAATNNAIVPPPPTLHRQCSLSLPAPLSRKTVDEVWAEIHREQPVNPGIDHRQSRHGATTNAGNAGNAQRQPTFGEMTLEDFLVKAGVVREGYGPASPRPPPAPAPPPAAIQPQYGYDGGTGFGHVVGVGYGGGDHQGANGVYHGDGGYGNGGMRRLNGYGAAQQQLRVGSPASPVSSDGMACGQVDNGGVDAGGTKGGRKRMGDGGVEKVVERRQRRMIKNRESAARSRARKQAYTVELEAELNQLKEENARLKEEERRVQAVRKQLLALQIVEAMSERARANASVATRSMRRCKSGPW